MGDGEADGGPGLMSAGGAADGFNEQVFQGWPRGQDATNRKACGAERVATITQAIASAATPPIAAEKGPQRAKGEGSLTRKMACVLVVRVAVPSTTATGAWKGDEPVTLGNTAAACA